MEKEIIYDSKQRKAGHNISWAAIFAGAVTFVALELVFALISSAIGLGTVDLYDSSSWSSAGSGLIIWTVISLVLAFFVSGLVSGLAAGRAPGLHGFLSWALSVFMIVMVLVSGVGTVLSGAGQLLAVVGRGSQDFLATAGEAVGTAVEKVTAEVSEQLELKVDGEKIEGDLKQIMIDSEVEELQPAYLEKQIDQSVVEIKAAAKEAVKNPENAAAIAEDLLNSLKARADEIADSVDQDAVAKAVAKNSDLSEKEAKEASEKLVAAYQKTAKEAKVKINEAEVKIEELKVEAEAKYAEAKQAADDAINATAKASAYAAVAFILSAVVAIFGAKVGRNMAVKRFTVESI